MIKNIFIVLTVISSITAYGQSIIGQWETYDDKTKEKKGVVEIYKNDDAYFAKIVKTYVGPKNAVCKACDGAKKDQPIIGLVIIENLTKDDDEFNGGSILDPENGKTYKCYLKLVSDNKLKVRGYLGVSLFGRTQYWMRKNP